MTLLDYAGRHWISLRDLSSEWGIGYQTLKQYSMSQGAGKGGPQARNPSLQVRLRIEALSEGAIDAWADWPLANCANSSERRGDKEGKRGVESDDAVPN